MSDYFDRVERQIVRSVEAGFPRSRPMPRVSGYLGVAAAVVVVIVVAGAFLLARGAGPTGTAAHTANGHQLSVSFSITPATTLERRGAIARTAQILRARLHQAVPGAQVSWAGGHFVVHVPHPSRGAGAQILALAAPGRLEFYDWEASVITLNGKTVASELQAQNPAALEVSQGSGTAAPGDPRAGAVSLRAALALAALQPASLTPALVQAVGQGTGYPTAVQASAARYYVLRGAPALAGNDILDPHQSTLPGGGAGVSFKFTLAASMKFQALTAAIARRGRLLSRLGQTLNQHFAVVLDGRLIEVPYVDYKQYPVGLRAGQSVELGGSLTVQEAKDIAILLRYGPLPVNLRATG
jgi:preprotein translocase subunit SecD